MPQGCASPESYRQLALGLASEEAAEALENHLVDCPACVETVRNLETADQLAVALQSGAGRRPLADMEHVDKLIAHLLSRPPASSLPVSETVDGIGQAIVTPPDVTQDLYGFLRPAEGPDEIGRLGPYRILKVLGFGGMGVVFLAEDLQLQRRVALKSMKSSLAGNPKARARFLREARSAAALVHDHVVTIHQVGEDRGVPFLAMHLLQGESLDDRLLREGKLSAAEIARIGSEIASGLAAAHQHGLIHRDIKPGNIWLEGPLRRVKIVDFGVACAVGADSGAGDRGVERRIANSALTNIGAIVGTPAYMAPEQALGESVNARSDLFSLGCVLYRMATGVVPFQGEDVNDTLRAVTRQNPRPPREIVPTLPKELSALILRLLAKNPAERPASALALQDDLAKIRSRPSVFRTRGFRAVAAVVLAASAISLTVNYWPKAPLFQPAAVYSAGDFPLCAKVADVDGDGVPDLVLANFYSNDVSILLGRGDGSLQPARHIPSGKESAWVSVADLDRDGVADLIVACRGVSDAWPQGSVAVLRGKGGAGFYAPVHLAAGPHPTCVEAVDLDGDGKLDLLVVNAFHIGSVSILRGKGDGAFHERVSYPVGQHPNSMALGDFDGDGKIDIAVANVGSRSISVLLGAGAGVFRPGPTLQLKDPQSSARFVAAADFHGDGNTGLAVCDEGQQVIRRFRRDSDGTLVESGASRIGAGPRVLAVADCDGDGKLDIVVAEAGGKSVEVLRGRGNGTFQPAVLLPVGGEASFVAAAPLTGGAPDLIVTMRGQSNNVVVFRNVRKGANQ